MNLAVKRKKEVNLRKMFKFKFHQTPFRATIKLLRTKNNFKLFSYFSNTKYKENLQNEPVK